MVPFQPVVSVGDRALNQGRPIRPSRFSCTRAGAFRDGVPIDVTEQAREAGFRIPVSVTAAAWADCVEWLEAKPAIQEGSGRLWDLLFLAAVAAQAAAR